MLIASHEVLDENWCNFLIDEFEKNNNKATFSKEDSSFVDRVLFFQDMNEDARALATSILFATGIVIKNRWTLNELYIETCSLVKWYPGQSMGLHKDGHTLSTNSRTHTALLYLNSCQGGEVLFPQLGGTFQPDHGLMLIYDKEILHGIREVNSDRYTLSMWFTTDKEAEKIKINL